MFTELYNKTRENMSESEVIFSGDFEAFCESNEGAVCALKTSMDGVVDGVNTFFLLFAGALVFMMQAGFAMLCAGSVRQKNVKNIMLKNLLDACGGAVGFYTLGYGFAYGSSSTFFIGTSNFAIKGFTSGPELIGWFFQFAFAATAATIVAGTVAERCKMAAYLCYSLFLTAFVSSTCRSVCEQISFFILFFYRCLLYFCGTSFITCTDSSFITIGLSCGGSFHLE